MQAKTSRGFHVVITNPREENIIFKGQVGIEHGCHFGDKLSLIETKYSS